MSLRSRLLAELHRPWRKDPLSVAALALGYAGAGSVSITITETTLALAGQDGAPSLAVDLDAVGTLAALAQAILATPGYLATVAPGMGPVLASTLLEESARSLTATPAPFLAWSSPNWRVLEPARRLLRGAATRIDLALAQLNLLTAAGYFAELWGRYTTTPRRAAARGPLSEGSITVTAGSVYAVAGGNGTSTYAVWRRAEFETHPQLFVGATLIVGDVRAAIVAHRFKNVGDVDSLELAGGWPGPSQVSAPYRVEFPAESDAAYTARQRHELLRPRENNLAMARAITEDTGVSVPEVRDLRRRVYVVGGPLYRRPMPGRRYNTATAEVRVDGLPTVAVIAAAERHAAAGVTVLIRGAMRIRGSHSDTVVRVRRATIGPVPVMQIGVGRIGRTRIA